MFGMQDECISAAWSLVRLGCGAKCTWAAWSSVITGKQDERTCLSFAWNDLWYVVLNIKFGYPYV